MDLIVDTNLVIALEREAKRTRPGPARTFLSEHLNDRFFITFTVAGELACGNSASAQSDWMSLCRPYTILPWKRDTAWQYGEIFRLLKKTGTLIGTNDLWIAATALSYRMPLITSNLAEFRRVPTLEVISFS